MSSNVLGAACIGWCGGYGLAAISNMYKNMTNEKLAKWYAIVAKILGYGSALYVAIESLLSALN